MGSKSGSGKEKRKSRYEFRERYENIELYNISVMQFVLAFLIGGVVGTILETAWTYVTKGALQWRAGLIFVPIHPIYAIGALLMTMTLRPLYRLRYRNAAVFFGAATIGSAFELLASLVQSWVFGSNSWEYSQQPLNFAGRTSLSMAIIWGTLGLFWMTLALPRLLELIDSLEQDIANRIAGFGTSLFLASAILSSAAVIRWEMRASAHAGTSAIGLLLDTLFPDWIMKLFYPSLRFLAG